MFVYPSQLDVCFHRVGDNETVDDTFRDTLREGMSKVTLQLHRGHIYLSYFESRYEVVEYCSADGCRWRRRDSDNVRGPAVNELIELGSRVL